MFSLFSNVWIMYWRGGVGVLCVKRRIFIPIDVSTFFSFFLSLLKSLSIVCVCIFFQFSYLMMCICLYNQDSAQPILWNENDIRVYYFLHADALQPIISHSIRLKLSNIYLIYRYKCRSRERWETKGRNNK